MEKLTRGGTGTLRNSTIRHKSFLFFPLHFLSILLAQTKPSAFFLFPKGLKVSPLLLLSICGYSHIKWTFIFKGAVAGSNCCVSELKERHNYFTGTENEKGLIHFSTVTSITTRSYWGEKRTLKLKLCHVIFHVKVWSFSMYFFHICCSSVTVCFNIN